MRLSRRKSRRSTKTYRKKSKRRSYKKSKSRKQQSHAYRKYNGGDDGTKFTITNIAGTIIATFYINFTNDIGYLNRLSTNKAYPVLDKEEIRTKLRDNIRSYVEDNFNKQYEDDEIPEGFKREINVYIGVTSEVIRIFYNKIKTGTLYANYTKVYTPTYLINGHKFYNITNLIQYIILYYNKNKDAGETNITFAYTDTTNASSDIIKWNNFDGPEYDDYY